MTLQALQLYLSKLSAHGIVVFHVSNRFLELAPVVANLAAEEKLTCLYEQDAHISPEEAAAGKAPSMWMALARRPEDLGAIDKEHRWQHLGQMAGSVWTDDYSDILQVLNLHGPSL
jgi:hypothetical protein